MRAVTFELRMPSAFFSDRAAWITVADGLPRRGGKTGVEPLADD